MARRRQGIRRLLATGASCLVGRRNPVVAAALLASLSTPLHAQSQRLGGEIALASQLVDRGLAITPATPVLQGSLSWKLSGDWSLDVAGGVEVRSPGQPVVVLAGVSRSWALSGDWLAQASLNYYDYRAERGGGIPDRANANLYFTYRDTLTIGLSAIRASGSQDERLLGAADLGVSYPLARQVSLSIGAGVAQAAIAARDRGGYPYHRYGPDPVRVYGYGSLGLAWSNGPVRLQLDRNMSSLGTRRAYGSQAPSPWVASASWSF